MKLRKICVVGAYQIKNTKTPDDTRIETRIILIIQQKLKTYIVSRVSKDTSKILFKKGGRRVQVKRKRGM